jgi:putative glycerol-1-phosphate prenyltransferase
VEVQIKTIKHKMLLLQKKITQKADGILFLSLLSGKNPEYLIEQQIKDAPI